MTLLTVTNSVPKRPAAARNSIPLSRFPQEESRGGRVPPTPVGKQRCHRLPPQEGRRPLVHPLRSRLRRIDRSEQPQVSVIKSAEISRPRRIVYTKRLTLPPLILHNAPLFANNSAF